MSTGERGRTRDGRKPSSRPPAELAYATFLTTTTTRKSAIESRADAPIRHQSSTDRKRRGCRMQNVFETSPCCAYFLFVRFLALAVLVYKTRRPVRRGGCVRLLPVLRGSTGGVVRTSRPVYQGPYQARSHVTTPHHPPPRPRRLAGTHVVPLLWKQMRF